METEIKFNVIMEYDGTSWHIRVNDTMLVPGFRNQNSCTAIKRFLERNKQKICDAISKELE